MKPMSLEEHMTRKNTTPEPFNDYERKLLRAAAHSLLQLEPNQKRPHEPAIEKALELFQSIDDQAGILCCGDWQKSNENFDRAYAIYAAAQIHDRLIELGDLLIGRVNDGHHRLAIKAYLEAGAKEKIVAYVRKELEHLDRPGRACDDAIAVKDSALLIEVGDRCMGYHNYAVARLAYVNANAADKLRALAEILLQGEHPSEGVQIYKSDLMRNPPELALQARLDVAITHGQASTIRAIYAALEQAVPSELFIRLGDSCIELGDLGAAVVAYQEAGIKLRRKVLNDLGL